MKDKSKKLTVVNTDNRKPAPSGESTTQVVGGGSFGGISIGGGLDYLLKAIWDKVWEIKTDSQGNEYIFGKLPVVTQYGITMYADGEELDLPSIYAGLPIDGSTLIRDDNGVLMINPDIDLGGGASTWDELTGKPSWIGSTKPSYNYSEILQTPDLSVYALAKDLENYVTLNTEQTIAAHKNFLNGLSVGGLGITKSQDDVIYLDANLVVRGGITMYAEGTVDVPSIIDSLPIASTSAKGIASFNPNDFSVVDGYVSFIGGSGVDESVLADYAKKSDLSAYLPLSGGQMTGGISCPIEYDGNITGLAASCVFYYDNGLTARGSIDNKRSLMGYGKNNTTGYWYNIISVRGDSSNYGMYLASSMNLNNQENLYWNRQIGSGGDWQGERVILDSMNWSQYVTAGDGGNYLPLSGGVLTNGSLSNVLVVKGTGAYSGWKSPIQVLTPDIQTTGHVNIEVGKSSTSRNIAWFGFKYYGDGSYGNLLAMGLHSVDDALIINGHGYVGINTISPRGYLHVEGDFHAQTIHFIKNGDYFDQYGNMYLSSVAANWNVFNNAGTQLFSVNVNGNVLASGGITMYSDIRKKTKLQDVELSLKQIADAPLIEHYYNSDSNKTTHVGSIAQYWASMNDWFCKLDSEGFYTMEIQNAALASAISIARELTRYESKTDRTIRKLKKRISELEDEVERLKMN